MSVRLQRPACGRRGVFQPLEKIFPIVGKLAALLLLLAAPPARAWDGKGMPDPGEVVRYERLGPFEGTEREVAKEEGDGILELLRGWESFEDCRPSPQEERAKWIVRPWLPAPNLVLTAFSENGLIGHIEFHKRTDCATGGTRLEVALPGVRKHVPGEAADMLLSLFDAWEEADWKAFRDAEPFPRRYVLESNRHDGGTLSGTAKLFYGDGNLWRIIWEANRASVPDPDRPIPGTELVIPAPPERKPAGIWEGRIHDDIRDWPLPCQYVLGMDPRDGGTLSGVARLFYGDGGKWPVIWDANKDAVPDPDRPKPGTSLVIPALAEGAAP